MKFHQAPANGNIISACFADAVVINGERHKRSVIVRADKLIADWSPASIEDINEETLSAAAELADEGTVVLLGVGDKSPAPTPVWQAPFARRQIALEIMSLRAACGAYNILLGDGRAVVAALVIGGGG